MKDGHVRPSIPDDVDALENRLREGDLLDLGLENLEPRQALEDGLRSPLCFTIEVKGRPEGMFGLVLGSEYSAPWLLGTPDLMAVWVQFARESRLWWKLFRRLSPGPLMNELHRLNIVHRNWLEWLGAQVTETGPDQLTFYYD